MKLKANEFISDTATKDDLKQRFVCAQDFIKYFLCLFSIEKLNLSINASTPPIPHSSRNGAAFVELPHIDPFFCFSTHYSSSYDERKKRFDHEQQITSIRLRKDWAEKLREELERELTKVGYRCVDDVDDSDPEFDEDVRQTNVARRCSPTRHCV